MIEFSNEVKLAHLLSINFISLPQRILYNVSSTYSDKSIKM